MLDIDINMIKHIKTVIAIVINKIGLQWPPIIAKPLITLILLDKPEIKKPAPIKKAKPKAIAIYFIIAEVSLKSPFLKKNPTITKITPITMQIFAVRAWSMFIFILFSPSVRNGIELLADNIPPIIPDKRNIARATADLLFCFATPQYPWANKSPEIACDPIPTKNPETAYPYIEVNLKRFYFLP
jgi:hypothetical protein